MTLEQHAGNSVTQPSSQMNVLLGTHAVEINVSALFVSVLNSDLMNYLLDQ